MAKPEFCSQSLTESRDTWESKSGLKVYGWTQELGTS